MIVACTKPLYQLPSKINHNSFARSITAYSQQRSSSVPSISRTGMILEADLLMHELDKLAYLNCKESNPSSIHELKQEDAISRKNSTPPLEQSKEKNENLSHLNLDIHNSNSAFRRNYILKSDVCKSTKSNFLHSHLEESPWLHYYDGVANKSNKSNQNQKANVYNNINNNDYMLFVPKPISEPTKMDFNTVNCFDIDRGSKEIMISRYNQNDNLVDEHDTSIVLEEDEEAITVEIPMNYCKKTNGASNQNKSINSDSLLLLKQIPIYGQEVLKSPMQTSIGNSLEQQHQKVQLINQQELQPMMPNQQPLLLQQHPLIHQQKEAMLQQHQLEQQILQQQQMFQQQQLQKSIDNPQLMDQFNMPNPSNYIHINNYMPNQNMYFPMGAPNQMNPLMNQYYQQQPFNNYPYPLFPYQNRMPFPMMNINPQYHQQQSPNDTINPLNSINNQNFPKKTSSLHNSINNSIQNNNQNQQLKKQDNSIKRNCKQSSSLAINGYANYPDDSLAQFAPFLIKEQNGCRYIQDKVNSDPNFANNILFPHLKGEIIELICDPFGNYLFQVLIDALLPENLESLFKLIAPSLYDICISSHGTRVIQKIIDKLTTSEVLQRLFKETITHRLVNICKDQYGNHIIQKYISSSTQFIYDHLTSNFLDIVNSKHGCCVIQKAINVGNEKQIAQLLKLINKNIFHIITDQYGNYAIQFILSSENDLNIDPIITIVLENIVYLCKQKYSSNVLEKCFENSNKEIQKLIISELVKNNEIVCELITDLYGNYVIQKALLVTKDDNYIKMLTIIAENIYWIKKQNFGSKLIAKLLVTHKELGTIMTQMKNQMNGIGGNGNNNSSQINDDDNSYHSRNSENGNSMSYNTNGCYNNNNKGYQNRNNNYNNKKKPKENNWYKR